MPSLRFFAVVGTIALVGAAAPAHAAITSNALTTNAITSNAITSNAITSNSLTNNALASNALATIGSAVADLNGVTVEAISLPPAARH